MRHLALFLLLAAASPVLAPAQGPLAPSAAPAPSLKTLGQIEPRTDVLTLPSNAQAVYVISQPGSYYLSASLPFQTKSAIYIQADNVSLDLGGFTVTGNPGTANSYVGILATGTRKNVSVRNGFLVGWGGGGLGLNVVTGGEVRSVSATDSPGTGIAGVGYGIVTGPGFVVTECNVRGNNGVGLLVGQGSTVSRCLAAANGNVGFTGAADCAFTDCVARQNATTGFELGDHANVRGCTATGTTVGSNAGNGFRAQDGSVFLACTSSANAGAGFSFTEAGVVSYCIADANGSNNFSSGALATVVGCTSTRAGQNGFALGDGSQLVQSGAYLSTFNGVVVAQGSAVRDSNFFSNKTNGISVSGAYAAVTGNTASLNGTTGSTFAGIFCGSIYARVEGNQASGNIGYGINVAAPAPAGNAVLRNNARGNTVLSYSISASNDAGPLGQAATATSPFANLQ